MSPTGNERDELLQRLTRIQQLTDALLQVQSTGKLHRDLADRIGQEIAAARRALRPVHRADD